MSAAQTLDGKAILIVDDEPIIAIDVAQAFEEAGAKVTTSHSFRQALGLVTQLGFAAAIVDHAHGEGDSHELCALLATRGIPLVTYSGHRVIEGPCRDGPHVNKPADPRALLKIVSDLIQQ